MILFLFTFIASFFNAIMDATENENFFESCFSDWDQKFWYKRESWKYAKRVFGYKIDAWHLAKSAMIVFLLFGAILYEPVFGGIYDFLIAGSIWNFGFWLFYHKLFKVK